MSFACRRLLFVYFCVSVRFFVCRASVESNGLGDGINWVDYDSAISDSSKPTLVILHKSWCPACKSLKAKLSDYGPFEKLSKAFSMVNAKEDDPLHDRSEFDIDGSYIPRLFFLNKEGQILSEVQNTKGNPNYKYYHYNPETVIEAMNKVLQDSEAVKEEL